MVRLILPFLIVYVLPSASPFSHPSLFSHGPHPPYPIPLCLSPRPSLSHLSLTPGPTPPSPTLFSLLPHGPHPPHHPTLSLSLLHLLLTPHPPFPTPLCSPTAHTPVYLFLSSILRSTTLAFLDSVCCIHPSLSKLDANFITFHRLPHFRGGSPGQIVCL